MFQNVSKNEIREIEIFSPLLPSSEAVKDIVGLLPNSEASKANFRLLPSFETI